MITLEEVIKEFLFEKGYTDMQYFQKYLSLAIAGLRDMNNDVNGNVALIEVEPDEYGTIEMPKDYIDYIRISICCNGEVIPLGLNTKMCKYDKDFNKTIVVECADGKDDCEFTPHLDNTGTGCPTCKTCNNHICNCDSDGCNTTHYGQGQYRSKVGYYTVDKYNRLIRLSSNVNYPVVLEYLSSSQKIDGKYIVHPYSVEAIKAFIYWASIRSLKSSNLGAIQMAEQAYVKQKVLAGQRHKSTTLEEFKQAFKRNYRQTI